MKIVFIGAGSTIFVKNVLGDSMLCDVLKDSEMALYDINSDRLKESEILIKALNENINDNRATITTFLGEENRKAALKGADFVINAIQVGGYDPCTIIDFEIPKKYGLRQTIADTLGIGGIMRGLRTIPVMESIAKDIEEVCPNAWLLNYTNPMGIITGYLQQHTFVKTLGLCHSVQVCTKELFSGLGMEDKLPGAKELIAGINHMAWLLDIRDANGNDLYPEIRKKAAEKNLNEKHPDMVRYEYIRRFGYYCTESSEHNAEYSSLFIKSKYPELIDELQIPLDEYPRRCIEQIKGWKEQKEKIFDDGKITHTRSREYASRIMEAIVGNGIYQIGGNVLNNGLIDNLPAKACVEVPCLVNGSGITPCHVGELPEQLAAMNRLNINVQLLTIKAAFTKKREDIYRAAFLDPHTSAELSMDDIVKMCDELIDAHGDYMKMYR